MRIRLCYHILLKLREGCHLMIKVVLSANGYLKKYFTNGENYCVQLEDGATMKDFYDKVDVLYGEAWSSSIWSRDRKSFRKPMLVQVSGNDKIDINHKLRDGDEIAISRVIIGG